MNLKENITIVIPTHNRQHYLTRILDYYSNVDVQILVADSTNPRFKMRDKYNNVNYYHYPNMNFTEKITSTIKNIDTPYAVLCADDDFIVPSAIDKCIEFLNNNYDYSVALGKYLCFNKMANHWKIGYPEGVASESDDPSERFYNHLSSYHTPTFYAVHRVDIFKVIWEAAFNYTDDIRFGELLPTLLTVIYGKMKILDVFYSAKELNSDSFGQKTNSIAFFINEGSFARKYKRFRECLTNALVTEVDVSKRRAKTLINGAMNKYLGSSMFKMHLKARMKRIIEHFSLLDKFYCFLGHLKAMKRQKRKRQFSKLINSLPIEYDNPENSYYPDFVRIKKAIEKNAVG